MREGRIRLVFVADEIPATLQRLVEFLNEQMPRVEVLAVEIRQYRADGGTARAVARVVTDWAKAHPHIQVAGGFGLSYPSVTVSADTTRPRSRLWGVLSLYGNPNQGEKPMLEVRVKHMCRTPPYNQEEAQDNLIAGLRALGVPRQDAEQSLVVKRPNVPLDELTNGRAERLLALVDKWIDDVRAHAGEPEAAEDE